jgi:hypothetical protein
MASVARSFTKGMNEKKPCHGSGFIFLFDQIFRAPDISTVRGTQRHLHSDVPDS